MKKLINISTIIFFFLFMFMVLMIFFINNNQNKFTKIYLNSHFTSFVVDNKDNIFLVKNLTGNVKKITPDGKEFFLVKKMEVVLHF